MIERIKVLLTGNVDWCDPETGEPSESDHFSWRDRWSIFGFHSSNWGWVRRFGTLDCGCVRNPITRRMVLFRYRCLVHCPLDRSDEAMLMGEDL